jgi:hypothetical protein
MAALGRQVVPTAAAYSSCGGHSMTCPAGLVVLQSPACLLPASATAWT